jgi:phosphoserine phosphatase RsbU/P
MSYLGSKIGKLRNFIRGDEEIPIMYIHAFMAIVGSVSVLLILQFRELPLSGLEHSLLVLVEKTCVILVIAYVVSRLSYFTQVIEGTFTWKNQLVLILIFGGISIFGTYSGVEVFGAMANVRDLGPMVAGLIGGPIMGLGAGLIGGIYRLSLGGFTAVPCAISTILAGLLAGIVFLINKRRFVGVFWAVVFAVLIEAMHMTITYFVAKPQTQALAVVQELSIPMIFSNALGMLIFGLIISNLLRERETIRERDEYFDELERKKHELDVANKIQKSFLPEKLPEIPGFQVSALNLPAHEIGSDFYDFIPLSNQKIGITVADVTGESFPASLLMALSRTIIRSEATHEKTPQYLLNYLNQLIAVDIGPEVSITILYGELDLDKKEFTYVNAAHLAPLLFRAQEKELIELERDEESLGLLKDVILQDHHIKIQTGDILVFYTDGVIEALEKPTKTGKKVLEEVIRENHQYSASEITRQIKIRIGSKKYQHDLVLAILKAD